MAHPDPERQHDGEVPVHIGPKRSHGRGANWTVVIILGQPFDGAEIRRVGDHSEITIPFADRASAFAAAAATMVKVEPGEDHVIAGEVWRTQAIEAGDGF